MMETTQYFRQGDVLLKRVAAIENEKLDKVDGTTIALGEATGHHHTFRDQVLLFKQPEQTEATIVQVTDGEAVLEHQEHKAFAIPEGVYEKRMEVEYNPFLKQMERTVD